MCTTAVDFQSHPSAAAGENRSGTTGKHQRQAKRRRQQKKQSAKSRAAAAGAFGYAEYFWQDADASDADSDDEVLWHYSQGSSSSSGAYGKQPRGPSPGQGRPDWQWWSEEQESDETAKVVAEVKFKQMKEAYESLVMKAST
eukprot:gene11829-11973_t